MPDQLLARIRARDFTVAVIGLGYVGLPVSLAFVEAGFPVLALDVDDDKVQALRAGRCYIGHLAEARVREALATERFVATGDFESLARADAVLVCVPTPLSPQRDPDLSYVSSTVATIRRHLRPGQLIVLESTTYPGTTEELVCGMLEESGLRSGEDFFVAHSPEREEPGNTQFGTGDIPRLVGGCDPVSGDLAQALYDQVIRRTVRVSSARAAEAAKLTENIFRAVNIALVNELKVIYDRMGIDIWEVLDAAQTKPFGFTRFDPGPGWGGHCIPVDPFYLAWKSREYGLDTKFIELAGEINRLMPNYVIDKLQQAFNERGKALHGRSVLVLGLAYKRDVGDTRESPAIVLMQRLRERGCAAGYHDPHVPVMPATRNWPDHPLIRSTELSAETLAAQDAVILVTDHSDLDYGLIREHAPLIVDTRGVFREDSPRIVRA